MECPDFGEVEYVGVRDENAMDQSVWEASCDLTASKAGAACGLDPHMSRIMLVDIRLGKRPKPPPGWKESAVSAYIKEMGQKEQGAAEIEYLRARDLFDPENEVSFGETRWRRRLRGHCIGATPDMIILDKHTMAPKRLVEIKTLQSNAPQLDEQRFQNGELLKPHHVVQCLVQLYCTGLSKSHLFYYRARSGKYWCYEVVLNESRFPVVADWIMETLSVRNEEMYRVFPRSMRQRTRSERERILYTEFMKSG